MDTMGTRIRQARLRAGKTQRDLARAVGVSETALRNWETDENVPRADLGALLQQELDVDLGFGPHLQAVDPSPPVQRGRRGQTPRVSEALTAHLLAELSARDADSIAKSRRAAQRIADLEAEVARLRGRDIPRIGTDDTGRWAARHPDEPQDTT